MSEECSSIIQPNRHPAEAQTMVLEEPTAVATTSSTDMVQVKKPSKGHERTPSKDKDQQGKVKTPKDKSKKDKDRKSIKYHLYYYYSYISLPLINYYSFTTTRYMFMHPLSIFKKSDSRIESFISVVEHHKDFFVKCPQIDSYLVGMAFDYLQRTKPSIAPSQYSPNLLFCCLYLAWVCFDNTSVMRFAVANT
jgi:hypothetical protein